MKFILKITTAYILFASLSIWGLFKLDSYLGHNIEKNAHEFSTKEKPVSKYFSTFKQSLIELQLTFKDFKSDPNNFDKSTLFEENLEKIESIFLSQEVLNNKYDEKIILEILKDIRSMKNKITERFLIADGFQVELEDALHNYHSFILKNKLKKEYEIFYYKLLAIANEIKNNQVDQYDEIKPILAKKQTQILKSNYRKKELLNLHFKNFLNFSQLSLNNFEKMRSHIVQTQELIESLKTYQQKNYFKNPYDFESQVLGLKNKAHFFRKTIFIVGIFFNILICFIAIPSLKILFGHAKNYEQMKSKNVKTEFMPNEIHIVPESLKTSAKEHKVKQNKSIENKPKKKQEPFTPLYGPHLPVKQQVSKIHLNITSLETDMEIIEAAKKNIEDILNN